MAKLKCVQKHCVNIGLCVIQLAYDNNILILMLLYLQLLDTLPVCQDFNRQGCTRPTCRFVHIREGCGLQVVGCRVVVCRDAAAGTCRRAACRYYHIPVQLPPALRPP